MTTAIEFIGVYDADSTIIGEISYWVGARLGRTHCALCEITHGMFSVKREWKECSLELKSPFRTFHRNDAPPDVLAHVDNVLPVVVARTADGLRTVLDGSELERLGGSSRGFVDALVEWLADHEAGI